MQEQKVLENQECFRLPHKPGKLPDDLPPVLSYWIENGKPRINETALNITLALKAAEDAKLALEMKMKTEAAANETAAAAAAAANATAVAVAAAQSPAPTPKKVIDKMALDNFQIENWNPTARPTAKPTVAPSAPYTFKKLSAADRLGGFKKPAPAPAAGSTPATSDNAQVADELSEGENSGVSSM